MKSRTLVTVLLSLQILHIAILFTTAEDDSTTSVTQPTDNSLDEHKLLHECQHSDYRTYIKCLKRQKRHHAEDGGKFSIVIFSQKILLGLQTKKKLFFIRLLTSKKVKNRIEEEKMSGWICVTQLRVSNFLNFTYFT